MNDPIHVPIERIVTSFPFTVTIALQIPFFLCCERTCIKCSFRTNNTNSVLIRFRFIYRFQYISVVGKFGTSFCSQHYCLSYICSLCYDEREKNGSLRCIKLLHTKFMPMTLYLSFCRSFILSNLFCSCLPLQLFHFSLQWPMY